MIVIDKFSRYIKSYVLLLILQDLSGISAQNRIQGLARRNEFIFNNGQWPKEVRYGSLSSYSNFWITENYLKFESIEKTDSGSEDDEYTTTHTSLTIDLPGEIIGTTPEEKVDNYYNFLVGNNKELWQSNVAAYKKIKLRQNPNTELSIYYQNNVLKYDIIIDHLQTNVVPIGHFAELESNIYLVEGNKIKYKNLVYEIPKIFQINSTDTIEINFKYLIDKGDIFIQLEKFDPGLPIVIDPLIYSSYIGGSLNDYVSDIEIDDTGNMICAGRTESSNFPTTTTGWSQSLIGSYDIFISKVNQEGTALIFSTYFGSTDSDRPFGLKLNDSNQIFLTGYTSSASLPTTLGAYQTTYKGSHDAFVTRLNQSASGVIYSTLIGGTGEDAAKDLDIDDQGNFYIVGETGSSSYPTTNGAYQKTIKGSNYFEVFVTKIKFDASSLVYSTFLGGSYDDYAGGILAENSGCAYVTGFTLSNDFPVANGYDLTYGQGGDAFITKIQKNGKNLVHSSFLGGGGQEWGLEMVFDNTNNICVVGTATSGAGFPLFKNSYDTTYSFAEGFVLKIDTALNTIMASSLFGGAMEENVDAVSVDHLNNIFISGRSYSKDFPTTTGALQDSLSYFWDGYVIGLDSNCSKLVYSTYFGGSGNSDRVLDVETSNGYFYSGGSTASNDLKITQNAFQKTNKNKEEGFVVKACYNVRPIITGDTKVCEDGSLSLVAAGAEKVKWYYQSNLISESNRLTVSNMDSGKIGIYNVITSNKCRTDTFSIGVNLLPKPQFSIIGETEVCKSGKLLLQASDTTNRYIWSNKRNRKYNDSVVIKNITLADSGKYTVQGISKSTKCTTSNSVVVKIYPTPEIKLTGDLNYCEKDTLLVGLDTINIGKVRWQKNDIELTQNKVLKIDHLGMSDSGQYQVFIVDKNNCKSQDSFNVTVKAAPEIKMDSMYSLCEQNNLYIKLPEKYNYQWLGEQGNLLSTSDSLMIKRVELSDSGKYNVNVTASNGCKKNSIFNVNVLPIPKAIVYAPDTICYYNSLILSAKGADNYRWFINKDTFVNDTVSAYLFYNKQRIDVRLISTSGDGCVKDTSFVVVNKVKPSYSLGSKSSFCENDSMELQCPAGYSWKWTDQNGNEYVSKKINFLFKDTFNSGKYSYFISDDFGCKTDSVISITVNPLPYFSVMGKRSYFAGDTVLLKINGTDNNKVWLTSSDQLISDSVLEIINCSLKDSGLYKAFVTNGHGCSDTNYIHIKIQDKLNIVLNNIKTEFRFHKLNDDNLLFHSGSKVRSVLMYDQNGRLLKKQLIPGLLTFQVNVGELSSGMYIIQIVTLDNHQSSGSLFFK